MTITLEKANSLMRDIINEVSKAVIGKDEIKELLLIALLSKGHVLVEGLRGTAKTTIARTFARAIGGTFKRVQGTPDMLPSDILGFNLYHADGTSKFMPGPIFANVVLADELNRTTPRTQSALLEVMQEQQVTIEGETRKLQQPFIVIASQIPYGSPGTSQFSEVQTDRFMFRIWSGISTPEEEDRILQDIDVISEPHVNAVIEAADIVELQEGVKQVYVADSVRLYIVEIMDRLRRHQDLMHPPSTRASIALYNGARARAFFEGRDYVIPDDIKSLLIPVLQHRLQVNYEAEMENINTESIIGEAAAEVPVPKLEHA